MPTRTAPAPPQTLKQHKHLIHQHPQDSASPTTAENTDVLGSTAPTDTPATYATATIQPICAAKNAQTLPPPPPQPTNPPTKSQRPTPNPIQKEPPIDTQSGYLSPVDPYKFLALLGDYEHAKFIFDGFLYGFFTHFEGPEISSHSSNSFAALSNPAAVDDKLQKELAAGRVAGPFDHPPFANFKVSPLSLREKDTPGEYRLLHNLSHPYDDTAVNTNISHQNSTVQYEGIQEAIKHIQDLGPGCYMAKSDIQSAFRLVPLHASQHHLMGFMWRGKYYYDKFLPMGLSSSCQIFQKIASGIVYILKHKFNIDRIVNILDDFLFLALTKSVCNKALFTFRALCEHLGIPVALHKTSPEAGTSEIFTGIQLCSISMQARLPENKLSKYRENVLWFLDQSTVSLHQLKSIIGQLQFSTSVVRIGKPFLRRLIDNSCSSAPYNPHRRVSLYPSAKKDLRIWAQFLDHYNGISLIYQPTLTPSNSINLYSDASKQGWAGTYGSSWVQGTWPQSWVKKNIALLELYPICLLIHLFKHKLSGANILFHCDNQAIVTIINKQTSKNKDIMQLLRPLILALMTNNITFKAVYLSTHDNTLADAISRFQETTDLLTRHGLQSSPTTVPSHLLPHNYIP